MLRGIVDKGPLGSDFSFSHTPLIDADTAPVYATAAAIILRPNPDPLQGRVPVEKITQSS